MELSIKTKRFELTYGLTDLYIRIGSWEAYWNAAPLHHLVGPSEGGGRDG